MWLMPDVDREQERAEEGRAWLCVVTDRLSSEAECHRRGHLHRGLHCGCSSSCCRDGAPNEA